MTIPLFGDFRDPTSLMIALCFICTAIFAVYDRLMKGRTE